LHLLWPAHIALHCRQRSATMKRCNDVPASNNLPNGSSLAASSIQGSSVTTPSIVTMCRDSTPRQERNRESRQKPRQSVAVRQAESPVSANRDSSEEPEHARKGGEARSASE